MATVQYCNYDIKGTLAIAGATTLTGAATFGSSINMSDNQPINYGGQTMFTHTGSITRIGDNSSASVLSISGGNATFTGSITVGSTGAAPLLFTKSTYGGMDTDAFYRIKFQDQGGVANDVGIGQTATGNLGFNITSGKDFLFNGGTSGNALTLGSNGDAHFIGNVEVGDSTDIAMSSAVNGQLKIDGLGYDAAIALDDTAMRIYHNSSVRDLVLGTNETARLTIAGNSGNTTITGSLTTTGIVGLNTDFTIDVAGDINLDADGGDIKLKDGGTTFATFSKNGNDFHITANRQDGDMRFFGNDGGTSVNPLNFDMSAGGLATFLTTPVVGTRSAGDNTTRAASTAFVTTAVATGVGAYLPLAGGTMTGNIDFGDSVRARFGDGDDLQIVFDGNNSFIHNVDNGDLYLRQQATDKDIIFECDDGSGGLAQYFRLDGGAVETRFLKTTRHFDNVRARFGDSADLEIYHDGSNSIIEDSGTGVLAIRGSIVVIENASGANMLLGVSGAQAELYYNGSSKLQTTSTGVDVTGALSTTTNVSVGNNAFFVDNGKALFGAAYDLQIFHDGSNSRIKDTGAGDLIVSSNLLAIQNAAATETMAKFFENGSVDLYYDDSKRFETSNTGIEVTGTGSFSSATDQILNLNSTDNNAVYTAFKRSNSRIGYVGYGGGGPTLNFANELAGKVLIQNTNGSLTINTDGSAAFTGDLTVSGGDIILGGTGRIQGIDTVSAGTDAASKAYVDGLVTGGLTFKDGFNAGSGVIDGGGNLTTGASRVAISIGDYYVVTTSGSFYGSISLDDGDSVICKQAAAAGTSDINDWVVVQSDEGVSQFSSSNAITASSGQAITSQTASVGSVTLQSFAYNGSTNVGHVPTGGSSSTFLRGDGNWVIPTNSGGTVTSIATTNGITGGTITGSGTIQVDSTVVRTSGSQSIAGTKTFGGISVFQNAGGIQTKRIDTPNGQQLVLNAGESSGQATGQTGELVYLNAESGIQINSSPDNWSSGWAGRKTTTINDSSGNSTFDNDITVLGGDITLGGTGRIQGIDTVLATTDAVNKQYVDAGHDDDITVLAFSGTTTQTLTATQRDATTLTAAFNITKTQSGGTGPSQENLNTIGDAVTVGQMEYRGFNNSSTNKPPTSDNANGVISVGQHNGGYGAQLAFSSDGNMYWRDNPSTSFGSWYKVLDANNTSGGPFLPLAGGTMTGRITTTSSEAMRINSTDGFISGYTSNGATRNGYIQFKSNGVVIDAETGNRAITLGLNNLNKVGIGTLTPGGKLDIFYSGTGGTGTFGIGEGLNITSLTPNLTFNDLSSSVDNYAIHLNQNVFTIGRYTSSTAQNADLVLASGNATFGGNVTVTGGTLTLGSDVSIFRDGVNILRTDDQLHANNDIYLGGAGKIFDRANNNNYIELANTIIASTNVDVNGTILVNNEIKFIDANMSIFRVSGNMVLRTAGSSRLTIASTGQVKFDSYGGSFTGASQYLLGIDGSGNIVKSNSIPTVGNLYLPLAGGTMAGNINMGTNRINFGSTALKIYNDGTDSYVENVSGDMYIMQRADNADMSFQNDNGAGGDAEYFRLDGGSELTFFSKAIQTADNAKIFVGNAGDLAIYHNGSNSFIETSSSSTGDFYITARGTNHDLYLEAADDVYIRPQGNESGIDIIGNAGVSLYYDNSKKFETSNTGITVTGNIDGAANMFLQDYIYHSGDGNTFFGFDGNDQIAIKTAGNYNFFADSTATTLYAAGSQRLKTSSAGVTVTGNILFPTNNSALQVESSDNLLVQVKSGNTVMTFDSAIKTVANANFEFDAGLIDINGSTGSAGQLLSSTGTTVDWIDAPSGGGANGTTAEGTGSNANYFSKLATFTISSSSSFADLRAAFTIIGEETSNSAYAEISVMMRKGSSSATSLDAINIAVLNNVTNGDIESQISSNNFYLKYTSGATMAVDLYMKKNSTFGQFDIIETASNFDDWVTTYYTNSAWISALPSTTYTIQTKVTSGTFITGAGFCRQETPFFGPQPTSPFPNWFPLSPNGPNNTVAKGSSAPSNFSFWQFQMPVDGVFQQVSISNKSRSFTNMKIRIFDQGNGTTYPGTEVFTGAPFSAAQHVMAVVPINVIMEAGTVYAMSIDINSSVNPNEYRITNLFAT